MNYYLRPSQFIFQSGILGVNIAVAVLIASVLMGLTVGFLAAFMEKKTNFFKNQFRIKSKSCNEGSCAPEDKDNSFDKNNEYTDICCTAKSNKSASIAEKLRLKNFFQEIYESGIKRILLYFTIFIAIGQLIEIFIPVEWILTLFSPGNLYSVPLAALIGLPLYVSGSASLPLLKSLLDVGAGEGAILAFLIAGQATSMAVIMGISTFIRRKAVFFYITFIMTGAILSGYIYQLIAG